MLAIYLSLEDGQAAFSIEKSHRVGDVYLGEVSLRGDGCGWAPFCADVPPAQIFAQVERPHLDGIEGGLFWRIAKVHRAPRQSGEEGAATKRAPTPKGSTLLTETGEVRLPDQSLV